MLNLSLFLYIVIFNYLMIMVIKITNELDITKESNEPLIL
ncbi:hypothetical protein SACC_15940 [Saccharolobus caldissimus]|uniref:Uncharacterized protein n=1 Tax=Saccharolobus caldissimus TaxID=1702097 RepID=A0AAQ4CRZ6_9CREN|nr:hypothetical protein SACC_15940 [Saccharolobus caldissimus]